MRVPITSAATLERAFQSIGRKLEERPAALISCLESLAEKHGSAVVERAVALVCLGRADGVAHVVRAAAQQLSMRRAVIAAAASLELTEGDDFDPIAFANAVLFSIPVEGEA